ncbi:MAG: ABC transporter ATP-binding protein [Lachnospiraceae bacterium]|nr:ABC transporter ATP-binding protein [Lachnospiraceae bacterium]
MEKQGNEFLEVKNLCVEYTSDKKIVHAVNGISFTMKKGETLAIVGETGAGKTTLAKTIMRILPDPPAKIREGEVWLDGENLLEKPEKEMTEIRGKKVAMIFQDPMTALNPVKTVGSQIVDCYLLHGYSNKDEACKKAKEMLELVGIPVTRFGEYPFQFSGGMKQRVVIAMALACNPELILADEPTTALDVTIQAQVIGLINDLKKQYSASMILITHDLGVVAQTSDRVIVVYAGTVVEAGERNDVFLNPSHPYTKGLFSSLPSMDKKVRRLTPIEGLPADPTNLPSGCPFHPRCPQSTEKCRQGQMPVVELEPGHFCACCNLKHGGTADE